MSALTHATKRIVLATGLYRSARWLSTRLRKGQLQAFREEVAFYRSLIPRGALCFDVGANIGDKSESLLAAGARRVIAFEPNPNVHRELRARFGHDSRWSLVPSAVGSGPPTQTFYINAIHNVSSLKADWGGVEGEWGGRIIAEQRVPVITLDEAIEKWGLPDFCKIDVEGWEPQVLSGLSRSIPLVSFEFVLGKGVERAKICLARFADLEPEALVNLAPAETARFHFTEWRPLFEFIKWFPGDLRQTLPGALYGDLFVRA